jgi:hypothetical protein
MALRFEHTAARTLTALDAHRASATGNAIGGVGAVMPDEGVERPVGIGNHADSVAANQDGHVRTFARGFGGIEDLLGVFGEPAHAELIAKAIEDSRAFCELGQFQNIRLRMKLSNALKPSRLLAGAQS